MQTSENKLSFINKKIIVGSASPRRKELINGLGLNFSIDPINADESFPSNLQSFEIPLYLAEKKSNGYNKIINPNEILLTADTIVWLEEKVLNKPESRVEAFEMLKSLSGKKHEVYTGVCLRDSKKIKLFYDKTEVFFKVLNENEINYYIDHFPVYDKAGSYGVQDWIGYIGIEKINGSFYNVMGLPVNIVYNEIINF